MMKKCHLLFCLTVVGFPLVLGFSKKIKLGGLFEEDDESQQAFVLSTSAANKLRRTTNELANVHLVPHIQLIQQDAFEISQNACALLGKGVAAIFGPSERISGEHVQSMCETVEVPNIVTRWDIEPVRMKAFNFYPHAQTLGMVLLDLVTDMRWKTCTILYDSSDSLIRTNQLLKRWDPNGHPVTIRHLGNGPDYRDLLSEVKESQEENIVIDCSYDIMERVLRQSQQVGLLSDRHRVIVNNLDLHTIDLEPYEYSGASFTGIRLVDVENSEAQKTFDTFLLEMGVDSLSKLRVNSALMYDAVQFFARSLKRAKDVKDGDIKALACDGTENWDYGTSLTNYMRTTEFKGLTGLVKFDTNGFRTDFELDIVQVGRKGLRKVGRYNSTSGIDWRINGQPVRPVDDDDLQNETFRVLIALSPPYNMLKESSTLRTGNDRYEGYTIDIIQELSKILRFNYTFIETDADYGGIDENGEWTGMVADIIDGEADLAITDLTITAERESAVDFTMPFMNLGISILYRKPTKAPPSTFSFLLPFSHEVWVHVMLVYVFCSVMICIVARMSTADWQSPFPGESESNELENQWTLKEAFWFMFGALMLQGSDVIPRGHSTRMMAIALSFFRMIIMNTYTANLASFMVVQTIVKPIKSAEDLANLNGGIKYGAKDGGSTYNFFRDSNYSTYVKMYKYMKENADAVLTDDNDEGLKKVLDVNQNYAFLMESSSIHYLRHRKCNVTQIGGLLDAKGYGIAMQKNSRYRDRLNTAVLHLQETGVLSQLQIKWWEERRGGGDCDNKVASTSASALSMEHVGGVFVISIIGIALAAIWAFCELLWEIGRTSYRHNVSFMDELMEEMRFIMKCRGSVKPARKYRTSSEMTEANARDNSPPYGFVPKITTTAVEN